MLQYGTSEGSQSLRQLTAGLLEKLDQTNGEQSLKIPYENLLITNGSQQFLYLVTETLCDPGDIVVVEDPTYFVYLSILQSHGIESRGIPMEPDGMSLPALEACLDKLAKSGDIRRLKFIYSVTYFQNPTGITTSLAKKRQIIDLLSRYESRAGHRIYFVEDAAYRELNFPDYSPPPSTLTFSDAQDRIIYTGTFSKPFATGIRVGYGVLPSSLRDSVLNLKGNHDFGSAHLLQGILAAAISSQDYEKQLVSSRKNYASKCALMIRSMKRHFPKSVTHTIPQGGLCLWVTLPKTLASGPKSKLFKAAIESGVLYVPGELAFGNDPTRRKPRNSLRLSFGSASRDKIQKGVTRLGQAIAARMA